MMSYEDKQVICLTLKKKAVIVVDYRWNKGMKATKEGDREDGAPGVPGREKKGE
jgi:hypothetical protein